MKRLRSALRPVLPDARDLHVYGGTLLVAAGVWSVWPPGGAMVLGVMLCALGLLVPGKSE